MGASVFPAVWPVVMFCSNEEEEEQEEQEEEDGGGWSGRKEGKRL